MMREPCGNCGELKECDHVWQCKHDVFSFEMRFCHECGAAITQIMREGVQVKKMTETIEDNTLQPQGTALHVPLTAKEFVIAAFKVSESKSILYRRYKTVEGLHDGIANAVQSGADYISLRIIKEKL